MQEPATLPDQQEPVHRRPPGRPVGAPGGDDHRRVRQRVHRSHVAADRAGAEPQPAVAAEQQARRSNTAGNRPARPGAEALPVQQHLLGLHTVGDRQPVAADGAAPGGQRVQRRLAGRHRRLHQARRDRRLPERAVGADSGLAVAAVVAQLAQPLQQRAQRADPDEPPGAQTQLHRLLLEPAHRERAAGASGAHRRRPGVCPEPRPLRGRQVRPQRLQCGRRPQGRPPRQEVAACAGAGPCLGDAAAGGRHRVCELPELQARGGEEEGPGARRRVRAVEAGVVPPTGAGRRRDLRRRGGEPDRVGRNGACVPAGAQGPRRRRRRRSGGREAAVEEQRGAGDGRRDGHPRQGPAPEHPEAARVPVARRAQLHRLRVHAARQPAPGAPAGGQGQRAAGAGLAAPVQDRARRRQGDHVPPPRLHAGRHPPRHQVHQHPARRGLRGQDRRLRHRQGRRGCLRLRVQLLRRNPWLPRAR